MHPDAALRDETFAEPAPQGPSMAHLPAKSALQLMRVDSTFIRVDGWELCQKNRKKRRTVPRPSVGVYFACVGRKSTLE